MANEKTPLRDTAAPTPKRAQTTTDRSTVARRRIVIGVVAALAALAVLWLLFGRGDESPLQQFNPFASETPPPPEFAFSKVTSKPEATVAHLNKGKLEKAAKRNGPAVEETLTQLLQVGYVDPDSWGDAGELDDFFTEDAATEVEPHIDVLSLGTDASETFASVNPGASKLKVTTLIDANLNPIRALGELTFRAKAANTDGSSTKIELIGTFFLVPDGDSWKIEAFDLDREDTPRKAKPSASAASPTASGAG